MNIRATKKFQKEGSLIYPEKIQRDVVEEWKAVFDGLDEHYSSGGNVSGTVEYGQRVYSITAAERNMIMLWPLLILGSALVIFNAIYLYAFKKTNR